MASCIFFIPVGILVTLTLLTPASGAPVTYDQRQEGKYNVQANLENFLIVVASSGRSDVLGDLALQALELQGLASRSKQKSGLQEVQSKEQVPEAVVYETEEANIGREPYHVEIVHIDKESDSSAEKKLLATVSEFNVAKELEKFNEKSLPAVEEHSEEKDLKTVASIGEEKLEKKTRSLWNSEGRKLEGTLEKQSGPVAAVEAAASGYQTETFEESKEELLKSGKPGLSLKKQLSKKDQESMYLSLHEKNDGPSHGGKLEELKLLGDAIENCGPGRFRDISGICQVDKSFPAK